MIINNPQLYLNSMIIVRDNIKRLQTRERLLTYNALHFKTDINASTLRNWFSKDIYPPLAKLDKLCDALQIHTADLFILNSDFSHEYTKPNHSAENFLINFEKICIEKMIFTIEKKADIIGSIELYKAYFYTKRPIATARLDGIAQALNVDTYQLLL